MNIHFRGFTSQYYNKGGSRDADEIDSMSTALALIQKTLFPSAGGMKISEKQDPSDSAILTRLSGIINPNLSNSQVTHSIIYLGWLMFFSFASIFGALAPLSMQMNRNLEEEPHNHIPSGDFQI